MPFCFIFFTSNQSTFFPVCLSLSPFTCPYLFSAQAVVMTIDMYVIGHASVSGYFSVFVFLFVCMFVWSCVCLCVSALSYRQAILSWCPQSHLDLVGWKHCLLSDTLLNFQGATLSCSYILSQKYTCFLGLQSTLWHPPSWAEQLFQNTKCPAQQIFDPEQVNHKTGACEPAQWWENAFGEGQGRSF